MNHLKLTKSNRNIKSFGFSFLWAKIEYAEKISIGKLNYYTN